MSNPLFIVYVIENEPGKFKACLAFHAANIRMARALAVTRFIEEFPELDDECFSFYVYSERPELPRGALNSWDIAIMNSYEWDSNKELPVAKMAEESELVAFGKLSPDVKNAVLIIYDTDEIRKEQLKPAMELAQCDTGSFDEQILEALNKTPEINNMFSERKLQVINWVRAKCDENAKWPVIKAEMINWKKRRDSDHKGDISPKTIKEDTVQNTNNVSGDALQNNGNCSANDDVSVEYRPVRPYQQTYSNLDKELAIAFWPGDVDPANIEPEILDWAQSNVIDKDRDDWKRFSMSMRTQANALKYDLLTIRDIVQQRPTDVHKSPVALNKYIEEFLTTYGVIDDAPEQEQENTTATLDHSASTPGPVGQELHEDAAATGTMETKTPVERQGPFYWRDNEGNTGRANKLEKLEELIANGCIEVTKEEHLALKTGVKPETVPPVTTTDEVNRQLAAQRGESVEEKNTPDDSRWVKDENKQIHSENADCIDSVSVPQALTTVPDTTFIARADQLEKDLGDSENLKLWRSVMRTNPRYTKDMSGTGFEGTSINAEYMVMRATETFGPVGIGWGFDVLQDEMKSGAPMSEPIYENNKFIGKKLIRDVEGNLITSLHHSIKISLWYIMNGQRGTVTAFGATDYMYMSNKKGIIVDGEAQKKSLTDAIKKGLSLLGFSADIWLGHYDDAAYKEESKLEFEIKDASDKADDTARIREELDQRFKGNVETMRNAVSPNEISKIASSLTRTIGVHLKTAKDKADSEYTKYLEGRLTRLEAVKLECLKQLEEKA